MPEDFILVGRDDEAAATPISSFWDGNAWVAVADPAAAGAFNDALVFSNITVEEMRVNEGDFQKLYVDRNVELRKVTVTITLV